MRSSSFTGCNLSQLVPSSSCIAPQIGGFPFATSAFPSALATGISLGSCRFLIEAGTAYVLSEDVLTVLTDTLCYDQAVLFIFSLLYRRELSTLR